MPLLEKPQPPALPSGRASILLPSNPAPRRWPRVLLVILIFGLFGAFLLSGFDAPTAAPDTPAPYQPNTITQPAIDDNVLLQADRVAAEGDRYALELERDRVAAELSELSQKITQADQQQQLAILRRQQELEVDRQAIDNQIREWDAQRAKLLADAQANAEAAALATEADRQQAAATAELAKAREAQAKAEAYAYAANAIGYTIAGSAAFLLMVATVALAYFLAGVAYSHTHYTRPTPPPPMPKQLPAPTPTAAPDPALISLQELMQEIERTPNSRAHGVPTAAPVRDNPPRVRTQVQPSTGQVPDTQPAKIRPTRNLTDEQKRRVLAAYHHQNGSVRATGRQVFTYANGKTDDIIRNVVKEFEEITR